MQFLHLKKNNNKLQKQMYDLETKVRIKQLTESNDSDDSGMTVDMSKEGTTVSRLLETRKAVSFGETGRNLITYSTETIFSNKTIKV